VTEITVVVPARNASATIGRTLAALAAQETTLTYEVLVVDSGSSDETVAIASSAEVVSQVLHNPGGEPAGSRNLGVSHGNGRVLAFTDADCEPAPDWLAAGVRALERAEIVQGAVVPRGVAGPFDRTLGVSDEYGLYETANLFVRRDCFERIGGFEPVLALDSGELVPGLAVGAGLGTGTDTRPFGEDTWFVWRAKRAGARTGFATDAVVRHAVFPRSPGGFVAEAARVRYFPPLVALIPELRDEFLHRRWFLSPSSLRFDLAIGGLAVTALSRRRLPGLAAVVVYALPLAREARHMSGRERLRVPAARIATDVVTFASLVRGSHRARTLVL
jgi:glycosyltransferase involved in cell wall biosynthesis